ncbi:sigma-70 family RNA polymerase sigma factor [uncultured Clostridium sp.]|uniref:sigma-70 family RNA polymerase sigma factor n=1 Tax=uncultured Clostridium sp. TaxID=59620 RepID=UPI0025EFA4CD|nr:sigma-70 family RNA polymerase sigma factor [uncultured Clostridium sp.]MDU4884105.1 sigma-70 family RNA polymerase sigma factor [Clostridium celatum]
MKGANKLEASVDNLSKDELIMEVKRAKLGDKEAFCNLIRINKIAIYRVAKSILNNEEDIEDAVSEAILKAYKNIQALKQEVFFKTWLIRIVINESNNLYKKRAKEIAVDKDHFKNIKVNDNYKDLSLYNAINSLDEDLRITTILFYFEDMKYKDIAKVLNVKEGTIKSRLSRAKEKLYNILKEELHG